MKKHGYDLSRRYDKVYWSCTRKRRYATQETALFAGGARLSFINEKTGRKPIPTEAYRCDHCHCWHIARLP